MHTVESRENFGAFVRGKDGAARAFELANAGVAVEADEEDVAKAARLLEGGNVAGMQKVKAAVGEDDAAAIAFIAAELENRCVQIEDVRRQRDSVKDHTIRMMRKARNIVYHAGKPGRPDGRRAA